MGSYYIGPRGEVCGREDYFQLLGREDSFPALGRSNGSISGRRTDEDTDDGAECS